MTKSLNYEMGSVFKKIEKIREKVIFPYLTVILTFLVAAL